MKLLTLNTHSLREENYEEKLNIFSSAINKHRPGVVALQEIMQPKAEEGTLFQGITTVGAIPIKKGNHLINVLKRLETYKLNYKAVWLGIKCSYEKFDEGMAILTNEDITELKQIQLSKFSSYDNWKTRFALGAKIKNSWYYSVHFNWEKDCESPFENEWEKLHKELNNENKVWLMGDFNLEQNEGYRLITKTFKDTYVLAKIKDEGITVEGSIDGWNKSKNMKRIDYIFTNEDLEILSSNVIFNNRNEKSISDHYGILVTTDERNK